MALTAQAARKFFDAGKAYMANKPKGSGKTVVNGFTGSSIWHAIYAFPPTNQAFLQKGYDDFAKRWQPILAAFEKHDVYFALEVHPTEIAFDIASAQRALDAVGNHKRFGFNYDPSHLGYQGVDYVKFIRTFGKQIHHAHMKDVWWGHGDGTVGVDHQRLVPVHGPKTLQGIFGQGASRLHQCGQGVEAVGHIAGVLERLQGFALPHLVIGMNGLQAQHGQRQPCQCAAPALFCIGRIGTHMAVRVIRPAPVFDQRLSQLQAQRFANGVYLLRVYRLKLLANISFTRQRQHQLLEGGIELRMTQHLAQRFNQLRP